MSKAEDIIKSFGLDPSDIKDHALAEVTYPETVPGRVLHIDGDFLAYQVSADDSKSLSSMMHNHDVAVEALRLLAGAETVVSHLTASHGDKGGRYESAIIKEYQGNRKGKIKPKHLYTIKSWMHSKRGAISHEDQEADDGLCQSNWKAIQEGNPDLSVLVSKDKDLQMCSGWHLDWDDGTLEYVDGFGYVKLDRSKSSPKVIGKGTAFFWAQLLMGDTADNISGLPKLPGSVLNKIKPTKATLAAQAVLDDPKATEKRKASALKTLKNRKSGPCGAVNAFKVMTYLKNDKVAYKAIQELYKAYGETEGFKHWKTGKEVHWKKAFLSEANALWMRRNNNNDDVLDFFKGLE